MRLLGGRFFRGGAKRPLFWLRFKWKPPPALAWRSFLENITGNWIQNISIRAFCIRSRLAMEVP